MTTDTKSPESSIDTKLEKLRKELRKELYSETSALWQEFEARLALQESRRNN